MEKLQASYNDETKKLIKEATQEKANENLNFLIDLAMVTKDTMPIPEKPTAFAEAWNHPNANSFKNGEKPYAKSLQT